MILRELLLSAAIFLQAGIVVNAKVPGTVHTTSGYDHLHGIDAICWSAPNYEYHDWYDDTKCTENIQEEVEEDYEESFEGHLWENELMPTFLAGPTMMEQDCPQGTSLTLDIAHETVHGSDKLRTHRAYTYHFILEINLEAIRKQYGLSDDAFFYSHKVQRQQDGGGGGDGGQGEKTGLTHPQIAVRLQFCPLNGNLCSPFVFESEQVDTVEGHIHEEGDEHLGEREHNHDNVVITSDVWAEEHDHGHTENSDHESGAGEHEDHDDHRKSRHLLRRGRQQPFRTARSTESSRKSQRQLGATVPQTTISTLDPPAPTIPELFDRIQEAIYLMTNTTSRASTGLFVSKMRLVFNENYGFPERVVISYHQAEDAPATNAKATIVTLDDSVYFAELSHLNPLELYLDDVTTANASNTTASNNDSDATAISGIQQQLDQARSLWDSNRVAAYTFNYNVAFDGLQDKRHHDPSINRQATPYPWNVAVHEGHVETVADSHNQTIYPKQVSEEEDDSDNHHEEGSHGVEEETDGQDSHNHEVEDSDHEEEHGVEDDMDDHDPHNHEAEDSEEHAHDSHDQSEDENAHDSHDDGDEGGDGHDDHDHEWNAAASPFFYLEIPKTNESWFRMEYDIDIELELAGDYLPLAAVTFFMTNATIHGHDPGEPHEHGFDDEHSDHISGVDEFAILKLDIANLMKQRSVTYYDPIIINEVSETIAIISYVMIAFGGSAQLFFLHCTIIYRENNVMKLSQGFPFLMLLTFAGLIAIVSSAFYRPSNDIFCHLSTPLTMVPMQFMLAVVFGRLRRIITVMEPLMGFTNMRKDRRAMKQGFGRWKQVMMDRYSNSQSTENRGSKLSSKLSSLNTGSEDSCSPKKDGNTSAPSRKRMFGKRQSPFVPKSAAAIRQQYTVHELWVSIFLATLPMIIIEVVRAGLSSQNRLLHLNEQESEGRYECGSSSNDQVFDFASAGVLFITILIDLYQVQKSKKLPALFNEAESVSTALVFSLFVAAFGYGVVFYLDKPTEDPSFSYLALVIIVLVFCLQLTARLLIPKLKLIWSGEKVVVARLLQEHRQKKVAKEQKKDAQGKFGNSCVTGMDFSPSNTDRTNNRNVPSAAFSGGSSRNSFAVDSQRQLPSEMLSVNEAQEEDSGVQKSVGLQNIDENDTEATDRCTSNLPNRHSAPRHRKRLVISEEHAPPTKLAMNVLSVSNEMTRVNERIMNGLQVNNEEWKNMVQAIDEFQALLADIEFQ